MGRVWRFFAAWGLDVLVVCRRGGERDRHGAADDADRPDGLQLWFEVAAFSVVLLALLARRRFPFLAPAFVWVARPALSFVDGKLIATQAGVFLCGMGAAVLLGSLRSGLQSRVGLVLVLVGAAVVVYNDPTARAGGPRLHPGALRRRLAGGLRAARADRADARPRRSGRCGPSGSGSRRPGWRWPRSGPGWRASSTTSSPTR